MIFVKFILHLVNQTLQTMKTRFLFPNRARHLGMLLFVIGLSFYSLSLYLNSLPQTDGRIFVWHHFFAPGTHPLEVNGDECFDDEIQLSLILIGLLLIANSKEKMEDEYIASLRLESLQWAVYINYAVFFVLIFVSYGLSFFAYTFYNVLTLLVFFIIRFRWKIFSLNRSLKADVA